MGNKEMKVYSVKLENLNTVEEPDSIGIKKAYNLSKIYFLNIF